MNSLLRSIHCPVLVLTLFTFAVLVFGGDVSAGSLTVVENLVTLSPAYETAPILGNDGNGDLVAYTSRDLLITGLFDQADVYYQRLVFGMPAGDPVRLAASLTDDQLDDVSGDYIVYTAYDSILATSGSVMLYQISTGQLRALGSSMYIQEARISGNNVVWRQGGTDAAEVILYDLAANTYKVIGGPLPAAFNVDMGDRFVVWSSRETPTGDFDIEVFDLATGEQFPITASANLDERNPATSGDWIVWAESDHGLPDNGSRPSRIMAQSLSTWEVRIIVDNGASNRLPSVDGDLIAWEGNPNGDYDVFIYRISTDETFTITFDPGDQYLNDIHGNLVAYVDMRNGNEDILTATLQFSHPPVANAGPDQTVPVGTVAQLNGSATDPDNDPIVSWAWTMDSAPAASLALLSDPTVSNPSFIPDVAGNYNLSLIVKDVQNEASLPDTMTVTAAPNLPPVASASADVATGSAPLTVNFSAAGSYDPEGGAITFAWDFTGDSTTDATGSSPAFTYTEPGTYLATLTVTDPLGQIDQDFVTLDVLAPNMPPIVNPTATPTGGTVPLKVRFNAGASDAEDDLLTYLWDFGDGAASTKSAPRHTYGVPGTYTATVTVSDGHAEVSGAVTVQVDESPSSHGQLVRKLFVKFDERKGHGNDAKKHGRSGMIQLEFDMPPVDLLPGSLIAVSVEGVVLVSAPWEDFIANWRDAGHATWRSWNRTVEIDTRKMRGTVFARKMNLLSIRPDNGLEVVITVANVTAVEVLTPHRLKHTLVYVRDDMRKGHDWHRSEARADSGQDPAQAPGPANTARVHSAQHISERMLRQNNKP